MPVLLPFQSRWYQECVVPLPQLSRESKKQEFYLFRSKPMIQGASILGIFIAEAAVGMNDDPLLRGCDVFELSWIEATSDAG